ncbi:hypothetical protein AWC11_07365 [Mycobacterium interjectum]|nr:hypothetical protein AWC11_07365 [Mycobacterium interjectum]
MFIVAPLTQRHNPTDNTNTKGYPVVYEDLENGYATSPVAFEETRDAAQKRADALNKALA